jgi:hypothetical protein
MPMANQMWPFEERDEEHEQIAVLRMIADGGPQSPFDVLLEWIDENVQLLTGRDHANSFTPERTQYRLEVQSRILRKVQDGALDKQLKPSVGKSDANKEESDVRN